MSGDGIVDWGIGRRVAGTLSGGAGDDVGLDPATVREAGDRALERVLGYTGLQAGTQTPPMESVSRADWIDSNMADLRALAAPFEARAAEEVSLPGPLEGLVRGGLGAASGAEAGVVLGYASRRVLGQYQVALTPAPRPPRLLVVGRNVSEAARQMDVDADRFLLWIGVHEQTHAVQFAAVPWLREHLAGRIGRLVEAASGQVDIPALVGFAGRVVTRDPRRVLREALRGELMRALAGPDQAAILDELQAAMAVIEGYAEHVMDAAAADDDELARMRARMDERRARRGGLGEIVARALGLGMKLRQYELGKAWSDEVAGTTGIHGLNRVWERPESLPSAAELEDPAAWVTRVSSAPVAGPA